MLLFLSSFINQAHALPVPIEIWQHGKCGFVEHRVNKHNKKNGAMSADETFAFVDDLLQKHKKALSVNRTNFSMGFYECLAEKEYLSDSKWQAIQNAPLESFLTPEQLRKYAPPEFAFGDQVAFEKPSNSDISPGFNQSRRIVKLQCAAKLKAAFSLVIKNEPNEHSLNNYSRIPRR